MVEATHENMYGESPAAPVVKFGPSKFLYLSVRCPSLEHQQRTLPVSTEIRPAGAEVEALSYCQLE